MKAINFIVNTISILVITSSLSGGLAIGLWTIFYYSLEDLFKLSCLSINIIFFYFWLQVRK